MKVLIETKKPQRRYRVAGMVSKLGAAYALAEGILRIRVRRWPQPVLSSRGEICLPIVSRRRWKSPVHTESGNTVN